MYVVDTILRPCRCYMYSSVDVTVTCRVVCMLLLHVQLCGCQCYMHSCVNVTVTCKLL